MSKLSFRARALDASKPMPIYLAEELPDLPDYSAINRAVPQMPSGMEKEEESEHHLQRAISGTGLIIPTPEVCEVTDLVFYERCYPPDYKMPKQHIHMQPLWEEQEAPEYDIDSEDERWLKQQRHPDLTELVFEQMMDKLEKCSGQTVVTLSEAKLLLERHDDLVIAVYDYWLNKRLNTQHPLILSVRTESRPGQPANNPYLAFRRRTEKMQTRKNRKNDESSYEKMLKLRRDLARALSLLQLVAKRERAKRDLVRLTHALAAARYRAGDFLPEPPARVPHPAPHPAHLAHADAAQHRAVLAAVSAGAGAGALRRDALAQYGHCAPPAHRDLAPRQREKRPYKRKKHRHHPLGVIPPTHRTECADGVSSSEEEAVGDTPASPPDPGPFAFRRKPGCYYELPTSTLCGEPLPAERDTNVRYEHELDERHRFSLTSLSAPAGCVGLARRRVGRGGRVLLDRRRCPLGALWAALPHTALLPAAGPARAHRSEEVELETKAHRTPKEMCRDFHASGRYPWRHAFRSHLARNPHLWIADLKDTDLKDTDLKDTDLKDTDLKMDVDLPQDSDISIRTMDECSDARVAMDSAVRDNLRRAMRKRTWSACSDDSADGDSDGPLYPVEREFDKFINEVTRKWLHFRPKTPPASPDSETEPTLAPLRPLEPFAVELRPLGGELPSAGLEPFTTADLTLAALFPDVGPPDDNTVGGKAKAGAEDLEDTDTFLSQGQGLCGRARPGWGATGSSRVAVRAPAPPAVPRPRAATPPPPPPVERPPTPVKKLPPVVKEDTKREERERERAERERERHERERERQERERERRAEWTTPSPVPNSKIIVEEVNEVPQQIKAEKKKSSETIEEVVVGGGVQLAAVQRHSPLKKHVISGARRADVAHDGAHAHAHGSQLLTVAVSNNLKVRIQNHIVSERSGEAGVATVSSAAVVGLVQNGPFASVAVSSAAHTLLHTTHTAASVVASAGVAGAGRRAVAAGAVTSRPLVQLTGGVSVAGLAASSAPVVLAPSHTIHHVAPNKLKVLHAHPLTNTQRNQLLAQNRNITQLPAVVSLATLGEAKTSNTALLKAAPGSVAQFFEIKGTQFPKGPHLVNVVRQAGGAAPKAGVARLDLADVKKRQVVATLDAAALKGNIQAVGRGRCVNVSVEGRSPRHAPHPAHAHAHPAHPAQPVAVRAHHLRHQIQLKGRALIPPVSGLRAAPMPALEPGKAAIPSSVVANLLHKNNQLAKGQKIAISSSVGGSVQAIAFSAAQLKARPARLAPPARHAEIVEAVAGPSGGGGAGGGGAGAGGAGAAGDGEGGDPAGVRRAADTLPMEVT